MYGLVSLILNSAAPYQLKSVLDDPVNGNKIYHFLADGKSQCELVL